MSTRSIAAAAVLIFTQWHVQPSDSLSMIPIVRHPRRIQHGSSRRRRQSCNTNDSNCGAPSSVTLGPWGTSRLSLHSRSNDDIGDRARPNDEQRNRRSFLARSAVLSLGTSILGSTTASSANARGLVRFPCKEPLSNKYHFVRAGTSLLEAEDIWSTNPLFLTNREAALSELGKTQILASTVATLKTKLSCAPTILRYSLAAASVDSADVIAEELNIGRDRMVPEFNYMDPRAMGGWDYAALNATEEAVWAMDNDEAGAYGRGGRPPANEDGTPSETLADQVVRLTNLMSVLETLYSGDTVLLVFPDGSGPALLSCLIGGIPLNRVHELQFCPGEIRCDVDYDSINALASQPPSQTYLNILERGRAELKELRENPDLLRNVKDLKYEEERVQEMKESDAKREADAEAKELERQRIREKEQERRDLEAKRKEEAKAIELAKDLEKQRKREEKMQLKTKSDQSSSDAGSEGSSSLGIAGAVVGVAAVALVALGGSDETDEVAVNGGSNAPVTGSEKEASFNATAGVVDPETDSVGTIANEGTNATNNDIANESQPNATATAVDTEMDQTGNANGGDNAALIDAEKEVLPDATLESDPETDAIYNLLKKRSDLPNGIPQGMLEDEQEFQKMSSNNDGQMQVDDMDYEDAWLGAMSDIMNDSDDEDK